MDYTFEKKLDAGLRCVYSSDILPYHNTFGVNVLIEILFNTDRILDSLPPTSIEYNNGFPEFEDATELGEIIDKLYKDGYLDCDTNIYKKNFKGRYFYKTGGYEKALKKDTKADHRAKANQRAILLLTVVVALGNVVSSVYYAQEIKHLSWIHSFDMMVSLWVFLFGIIAGLIIYQLIQHQLDQRKSK